MFEPAVPYDGCCVEGALDFSNVEYVCWITCLSLYQDRSGCDPSGHGAILSMELLCLVCICLLIYTICSRMWALYYSLMWNDVDVDVDDCFDVETIYLFM